MAFIDARKKQIQAKIVYYGPGRSGKTTNIEYLYKKFRDRTNSEIVSVSTHGDRTLFFDYLPLNLGKVKDHEITIQLYTVPGQVKYDSTRRLVLNGVDGVVFVADSMEVRREKNRESLRNLHENLKTYKKSIFDIPLVLQLNKRDLDKQGVPLTDPEEMKRELNGRLQAPVFEASAVSGDNVVNTLKQIIMLTQSSLAKSIN